jgi:polar amino acid transport system substrate-binding protein
MKIGKVFPHIKCYIERNYLAILGIALTLLILLVNVKEKPTITLNLSVCYWPGHMSKVSPKEGLIPEIVKAAFKNSGIKINYIIVNYPFSYGLAAEGFYDGTLGYHKFKEHEHLFDYSEATFTNDIVFFHLKNNSFSWKTLDDLKGIKIGADDHRGVFKKYPQKTYGESFVNKGLDITYITDPFLNMKKLMYEEIEVYPVPLRMGLGVLKDRFENSNDKFTYHPKALNRKSYHYLLLSKKVPLAKRKVILNRFNDGFKRLQKTGKLKEIYEKYQI